MSIGNFTRFAIGRSGRSDVARALLGRALGHRRHGVVLPLFIFYIHLNILYFYRGADIFWRSYIDKKTLFDGTDVRVVSALYCHACVAVSTFASFASGQTLCDEHK